VGGYSLLFGALAGLAVAVAAFAAWRVPSVSPSRRHRETLVGLVRRVRQPAFVQPVLVLAAATAALSAGVGYLPVLATRAHLGPVVGGAIVSLLAALAAFIQPRVGRALDSGRLQPGPGAGTGLLVTAGGLVVAATIGGAVALAVAAVLIGAGVGVATPLGFAALADTAPEGRMGQTMGAAEVGRELGDAGGPLLVGALAAASLSVGLAGLAAAVGVAGAASRRTVHAEHPDRADGRG
jgi:predicted MFS family arabinose efflux permease